MLAINLTIPNHDPAHFQPWQLHLRGFTCNKDKRSQMAFWHQLPVSFTAAQSDVHWQTDKLQNQDKPPKPSPKENANANWKQTMQAVMLQESADSTIVYNLPAGTTAMYMMTGSNYPHPNLVHVSPLLQWVWWWYTGIITDCHCFQFSTIIPSAGWRCLTCCSFSEICYFALLYFRGT